MEYGQPIFVWLSRDWPSVRTYASTDCKGGVGETIKRERGVSQACLGKSTSCILDIHSCQNRIATDQYHMTISRRHVSTHRGDVIYLEAVRWPVVLLDRDQCSISYFLASLRTQIDIYWTSMLWSIDSCQNRVQASTHRGQEFFEVIRWQVPSFQMIAGSS